MKKLVYILRYPVGILLFLAAALCQGAAGGIFSMSLFFLLILAECSSVYLENKNIIDLRLLLSLSWFFGIGLSALKLSHLQKPWGAMMWIVCGGFFLMFTAAYDLTGYLYGKYRKEQAVKASPSGMRREDPLFRKRIFRVIVIITVLALLAFLAECIAFDFQIPIFAVWKYEQYSVFHLSGIGYFTVLPVLTGPLAVYFLFLGKSSLPEKLVLLFCFAVALLIPLLVLSKMQMLFTLTVPVFTFFILQEKISKKKLFFGTVIFGILIVVLFVFLMRLKDYPDGYLQGIFSFKKEDTPMMIQYPYIYIVNNYENLNLLVENLQAFSFGKRQLYPFFALSGVKFLPGISDFLATEIYRTIEELTTTSILYDAYGDFGLFGALGFGAVLGALSAWITELAYSKKSVSGVLFYVQFAYYMLLSFFTTWFSNPTSWFYFAMTALMAVYIYRPLRTLRDRKKRKESGIS